MSLKLDIFLQNLKGLEDYLDNGRIEDARNAIAGIRMMLLSDKIDDEKERSQVVYDTAWFVDKLKRVRKLSNKIKSDGSRALCINFSDDILCWGWYEVQIDSAGREYRWCGGEREAGFTLECKENEYAALVLSIRPQEPETFSRNMLEIRVNGSPTQFEIVPNPHNHIFQIGLVPSVFRGDGFIDVSFYLKGSVGAVDRGDRNLAFNLFEFAWIPVGI